MSEDTANVSYGALGQSSIALRIVDGRRLEKKFRDVLKPGGVMSDSQGQAHQLPRYFYEIPSWDVAQEIQLSEHFADIAYRSMPGVYVRPFGTKTGYTDDHLHLDFGYVLAVPRGAPFETYNPKLDVEPL